MGMRPVGKPWGWRRWGAWRGWAAAAVLAGALLAGAVPASALAATNGGGGPFPLSMTELTNPSARPEVAQRQAVGCTLVGLGVTGVAIASGALASAGSGGTGGAAIGAVLSEIVTYFGAGCSIGAFLAGLFSMGGAPPAADVGG